MLNLPTTNLTDLLAWFAEYEDNELNDPYDKLYITTPILCLLQPYFCDDQQWYWLDVEEVPYTDDPAQFLDALNYFNDLDLLTLISEYTNSLANIYHTLYRYTDSKTEVLHLAYNGCSHHSGLSLYFIREI